MPLPRFHSYSWSDDEARKCAQQKAQSPAKDGPESLTDKELYVWVTYPGPKKARKRTGKNSDSHRKNLKLWTVVILDELKQVGAYSYDVKLRRIDKKGDRSIRVWVSNDPDDQSDEANVLAIVSPDLTRLSPLEQHLCHLAAVRVYEAIACTWPPVEDVSLPHVVPEVIVVEDPHSEHPNPSVPI